MFKRRPLHPELELACAFPVSNARSVPDNAGAIRRRHNTLDAPLRSPSLEDLFFTFTVLAAFSAPGLMLAA